MPDEITFIDLACLLRITQDTTLEKFGSAINASIFDASNLAGTLKQKSLIDFSSYYPGPNTIVLTDTGKALITEAEGKSTEAFDNLDQEILFQISGGKRLPLELQNTLNLRSKDLALRLYKQYKQGFLIYELKSGSAAVMLTEAGFLKAKAATVKPEMVPPQMAAQQSSANTQQPTPTSTDTAPTIEQPTAPKPQSKMMLYVAILVVLVIIVVAGLYLTKTI